MAGGLRSNTATILATVAFLTMNASCQSPPYACTQSATFITGSSAQLNGMAVANGLTSVAWFEWGVRGSYNQQTSPVDVGMGNSLVRVTAIVSTLTNAGIYQFRLVVSNAAAVRFGAIQLFTTGRRFVSWFGNQTFTTPGPGLSNIVSVAAGELFSLVLTADGSVKSLSTAQLIATNAVAISAGQTHGIALLADGTVTAWGDNRNGQTNVPAALTNVVMAVAGQDHNLALKSDGTVATWGSYTAFSPSSPAFVPSGLSNVVSISGGVAHSVALKADGTVTAWGSDYYGQLDIPPGLTNVVAIAAAAYVTFALRTDGTLVGWGQNSPSQPQASNLVAISAAASDISTLGLREDGTLLPWGGTAVPPNGLSNVVAVACAPSKGYALGPNLPPTAQGQLISGTANAQTVIVLHGADLNGDILSFRITALPQTGSLYQYADGLPGDPITTANTPVADSAGRVMFAPEPDSFGEPYASFNFIATDGELDSPPATMTISIVGRPYAVTQPATWGGMSNVVLNGMGVPNGLPAIAWFEWGPRGSFDHVSPPQSVGSGSSVLHLSVPIGTVASGIVYQSRLVVSNIAAITFGAPRLFGFHGSGKVAAWGANSSRQTTVPVGLSNVVSIAAGGGFHTLALRSDGKVVAWGADSSGQTNVPVGLSNVVAVGAGGSHSLALKSDGTVVAWGLNLYGQTNVPSGLTNVIAITGGGDQSLALKADGTVTAWGANHDGEATVPAGLSNVVAVAGGWHHSLALKADGTVVGWGDTRQGKTSNPAGLSNAVAIASAGGDFNLALTADGRVVAWGDNSYGQTNVPAVLSNVVAVATGSEHSLALLDSGTVVAWGDNTYHQGTVPVGLTNVTGLAGAFTHSVAIADNLPPTVLARAASGYPNHDLIAQLVGSDPNGDLVLFRIASLPTAGMLYQFAGGNRGPVIASVGETITDPLGRVIFAPATNALGAPHATFTYLANDGELDSAPASVSIYITLPLAPQLSAGGALWSPTTGFQLNFSGNTSATYRVWASSDLVDWTPLGAATATSNGWLQFLDLDSTNLPLRFYRAGAP